MDEKRKYEFLQKLGGLLTEYGVKLVPVPQWIPRDDGTYSMVIKMSVTEDTKKSDKIGIGET